MSHIVGDFRPGGDGFDKPEFILSVLIASILVLFTGFFFGEDLAKAVTEFVEKEAAAAAPAPESVRPRDYTELALGDELMRRYVFELKGENKRPGWLILDSRASDFRFDSVPDVGLDFIRYPGGERIQIPKGTHNPNLWQFVVKDGREDGEKQFFSFEVKPPCTLTLTVSRRR